MKFRKFTLLALLAFSSSCAMLFNDKEVDVSIASTPPGADIFIEGKNYGKTPATIKIEPKNYTVVVTKEGYGSTQLNLEYWVTARNGKCIADMLGTMLVIPYYSFYWSGKCNDFKQKEYFVTIPKSANAAGGSMMGVGQNPRDMIQYYYQQDGANGATNSGNGGARNGSNNPAARYPY
jgi:hypothetical protein